MKFEMMSDENEKYESKKILRCQQNRCTETTGKKLIGGVKTTENSGRQNLPSRKVLFMQFINLLIFYFHQFLELPVFLQNI